LEKKIHQDSVPSGCLTVLFNILWIVLGGFWIAVTHIILTLIFAITIIGIPFAQQHIKLAEVAVMPFGKHVV
jgi:uncharacterized membrane protein YccF (DUF307 family)